MGQVKVETDTHTHIHAHSFPDIYTDFLCNISKPYFFTAQQVVTGQKGCPGDLFKHVIITEKVVGVSSFIPPL